MTPVEATDPRTCRPLQSQSIFQFFVVTLHTHRMQSLNLCIQLATFKFLYRKQIHRAMGTALSRYFVEANDNNFFKCVKKPAAFFQHQLFVSTATF